MQRPHLRRKKQPCSHSRNTSLLGHRTRGKENRMGDSEAAQDERGLETSSGDQGSNQAESLRVGEVEDL